MDPNASVVLNANSANDVVQHITSAPMATVSNEPTHASALPPPTYSKPFPDISKIEVFNGDNFRRWQERVHSILDMHGVAFALTESSPSEPISSVNLWTHANKVCRHRLVCTPYWVVANHSDPQTGTPPRYPHKESISEKSNYLYASKVIRLKKKINKKNKTPFVLL